MDTIFVAKLIMSFVLGGTWVILATILADKYGSKLGGLIAGLPSTAIFALFFLAWTQTPDFAVRSTTIMPIGVGIENIYVLILILLASRGLWLTLLGGFAVWFLLAYGLVVVGFDNYFWSLILYALSTIIIFYLIERVLQIKSTGGRKIVYTPKIILMRGLLSGTIIALTIVMGKVGGPIFGGMGAVFPALVTSTMIITYLSHGADFAISTMKSVVPGLIGLVIYSVMVRLTYLPLGIIWGTLLSVFVAFLSGYLMFRFWLKKLK